MSRISEAVEQLQGDELVAFLSTFPYKPPRTPRQQRPEHGTPEYSAYYNDVADPGTGRREEDGWSEVEHLWATGKLDPEVFYAVVDSRLRSR